MTHRSFSRVCATLALSLSLCATLAPAWAKPTIPENLGAGLKALVLYHYSPSDPEAAQPDRAQYDREGRVLVEIYANGKLPLAELTTKLESLGVKILAVNTYYRSGAISAYLPIAKATLAAQLPGLGGIVLSHKPITNVGLTTSQGAVVHKTDLVNTAGFTGAGITVGLMSNSYNVSPTPYTTASQDVVNGDLPNLTNTNPNSPGVKFLIDDTSGTDEGRGMAQIVYDLAPGSALCFATAIGGQATFAANIRTLRTNPACLADIIVDDILYLAEPMFSDGQIAQAVNDVVSSTSTLAGKPVAYFSSAGNQGIGYNATFSLVSNSDARNTIDPADATINLRTVPANLTAGGFHNFAPTGAPIDISQKIVSAAASGTLVFQWNDPFDLAPSGITADYNILVFDSTGRYIASRSGKDNNFTTNEPLEIPPVALTADTTYYIAISKTSQTSSAPVTATALRYDLLGDGTLQADYLSVPRNTQATYGHNSAAGANGVAAYVYDSIPDNALPGSGFTPTYESYTAQGAVTIYFNANGVRLTTPEQRKKPDFAAVDGVNTSFFPGPDLGDISATDYEGDGFPNFFGTSAAAPHAAGIAALLLQKAGGPTSLSYQDIRTLLQTSAPARDADPGFSKAVGNAITVSGNGSGSTDPNFFRVSVGGAGVTLTALTINLTGANLNFDPTSTGFPLTTGSNTSPGATITSPAPTARSSVLNLTFNGLSSGLFLSFGIDRDVASINAYGNSADSLAGATITATFNSGAPVTATFANIIKTGYTVYDGFGLVDAQAASNLLP